MDSRIEPVQAFLLISLVLFVYCESTCLSGNLTVRVGQERVCIPCWHFEGCPPGHGWSVSCDSTVNNDYHVHCVPCEPGKSFSSVYDRTQCQPCSGKCLPHEVVLGECTIFYDNTTCSGTPTVVAKQESVGNSSTQHLAIPLWAFILLIFMASGFLIMGLVVGLMCYCRKRSWRTTNPGLEYHVAGPTDLEANNPLIIKNNNGQNESIPEFIELPEKNTSAGSCPPTNSALPRLLNSENETPASLSSPGGTPNTTHKTLFGGQKVTSPLATCEADGGADLLEVIPDKTKRASEHMECLVKVHKVSDMKPDSHRKLCQLFDYPRPLGGDHKTLADCLGYRKRDVDVFQQYAQPTEQMLEDWGGKQGNTLLTLMHLVREKIQREDILELLRSELMDVLCNCNHCPDLSQNAELVE